MQERAPALHNSLLRPARGVISTSLLAVTQPFSGSEAACCLLALLPGGRLSASPPQRDVGDGI